MLRSLLPRLDGALLVVGLLATAHFLYAAWVHSANPIWRTGIDAGWYSTADQATYLRIARGLADGALPTPLLGIGYSLAAVPFVELLPDDPFLLPNLCFYVASILFTFGLARQWLGTEWGAAAVLLLSQGGHYLRFFVRPWSNSVTAVCLAALLALAVLPPRRPLLAAGAVGFVLGWVFAARYGDAVLLLPVAVLVLGRAAGWAWRRLLLLALVAALAGAPLVGWVAAIHAEHFGSPLSTPYVHHKSPLNGADGQSLASRSPAHVGYHLFSTLVNPHIFTSEARLPPLIDSSADRPLLVSMFVLGLAGVGLVSLPRQWRGLVAAYGASLGLALLYYGSFWSSAAHDLKYGALRFSTPWLPLLVCAALVGLRRLLRTNWQQPSERRRVAIGLALPLLGALVLYGWGIALPPFPDTARLVPRLGWRASSSAPEGNPALAIDRSVARPWQAPGPLPAGTSLTIDMGRPYEVDHLFLAQRLGVRADGLRVGVELSLDGEEWTNPTSLQITLPQARILAFSFAPAPARYVRFGLREASPPAGWVIGEVYAYGRRPVPPVLP